MQFTDFSAIWMTLHNDIVEFKKDKSNRGKRNYIKNIVSLIEGLSYSLRVQILKDKQNELTLEEKFVLTELQYNINDRGLIKKIVKRHDTYSFFKFTFKTFGRCYGRENIISKGFENNNLNNLKNTFSKRNQITHPKKESDLIVTEVQYKEADDAYEWLYPFLLDCFDEIFIEKIN